MKAKNIILRFNLTKIATQSGKCQSSAINTKIALQIYALITYTTS